MPQHVVDATRNFVCPGWILYDGKSVYFTLLVIFNVEIGKIYNV